MFALCQRPLAAALAYSAVSLGQALHHSGFLPNYLEVGADDSGMLTGVGNSIANLPGVISPILAELIVRKTGLWLPFFVSSAAVEVVACIFFCSSCKVEPARSTLESSDQIYRSANCK